MDMGSMRSLIPVSTLEGWTRNFTLVVFYRKASETSAGCLLWEFACSQSGALFASLLLNDGLTFLKGLLPSLVACVVAQKPTSTKPRA